MLLVPTGTPVVTLTVPRPHVLWSTNERLHWSRRHRLTRAWRDAFTVYARANRQGALPQPSFVYVTLPVPDARRRDPHNYVGTVVKAVVDGLVSGGWWPDDTPEYVRVVEPGLQVQRNGDTLVPKVTVDIYEGEDVRHG